MVTLSKEHHTFGKTVQQHSTARVHIGWARYKLPSMTWEFVTGKSKPDNVHHWVKCYV